MITFYPFCFSKCHSLKFGEIILSFIRPKVNSVFAIHDTKALKLLIRRRLKVTHLSEHKFRHSFRDTGDPMSKCGLETEITLYFLQRCRVYSAIRTKLLDDRSTVDSSLANYHDEKLLNILLCGLEYYSAKTNIQKQSPRGVLGKRCSSKIRKIHRKTPVPGSLF